MNLLNLVTPWLDNVCQIKTKCYSIPKQKILRPKQAIAVERVAGDARLIEDETALCLLASLQGLAIAMFAWVYD